MSKTLWIYGDSFGVDWKVDWGWHRQLAGQLNVDKVVNQCCSGCAMGRFNKALVELYLTLGRMDLDYQWS